MPSSGALLLEDIVRPNDGAVGRPAWIPRGVRLRFAFAIVSLFPGGGLQRDCLDIARRLRRLGHEVTIYTSRFWGESFADDLTIKILNVAESTNHQWQAAFSAKLSETLSRSVRHDLVVGFDKLAGLDVLYCADGSMLARVKRKPYLFALPRYRSFIGLERECFSPKSDTKILLLSQKQLYEFQGAWRTIPQRLMLLPPTLVRERCRPEIRTKAMRTQLRAQLGLSDDDWVWLAVGVQPRTKGFDRAIKALADFGKARLLVAGLGSADAKAAGMVRLARGLGVSSRVHWLGHREDVPGLMAAADLLLHLARYDTTGTAILEAVVNGLPTICTATCGYAAHVSAAQAGIVIGQNFRTVSLNAALRVSQSRLRARQWSKAGIEYGQINDLYDGRQQAAEFMIATAVDQADGARQKDLISSHRALAYAG
jgi:UDP-glucose:(heptosyl)LPS alpha-1,3-glucosyltransferase